CGAALEQVLGDLAGLLGLGVAGGHVVGGGAGVGRRSLDGRGTAGLLGLGLGPGLLGPLAQVLGDLSHSSASSPYSGPERPPSFRTRQKWTAMKMTMTNGSISTCSVYHRSSVSVLISLLP